MSMNIGNMIKQSNIVIFFLDKDNNKFLKYNTTSNFCLRH